VKWLGPFLLCLSCLGDCVPFFNDFNYCRDEPSNPPWWISNSGEPSQLFFGGLYVSEEWGTNDLGLLPFLGGAAGVKIGVVDVDNGHAARVRELAASTGATVLFTAGLREGSGTFLQCQDLIDQGCRIIVVPWGWPDHSEMASNLCRLNPNVIFCCAVYNAALNTDTIIDYPASWAGEMANVVPVTNSDRNGQLYPVAAWGTNTLAAPGRNIVANGTYSSGTSYSTPITAACMALLVARMPNMSASQVVGVFRSTSVNIGLTRRIRPDEVMRLYSPTVVTLVIWESDNLKGSWFRIATNTHTSYSPAGFYRVTIEP
jgi:hypothetical protein